YNGRQLSTVYGLGSPGFCNVMIGTVLELRKRIYALGSRILRSSADLPFYNYSIYPFPVGLRHSRALWPGFGNTLYCSGNLPLHPLWNGSSGHAWFLQASARYQSGMVSWVLF